MSSSVAAWTPGAAEAGATQAVARARLAPHIGQNLSRSLISSPHVGQSRGDGDDVASESVMQSSLEDGKSQVEWQLGHGHATGTFRVMSKE